TNSKRYLIIRQFSFNSCSNCFISSVSDSSCVNNRYTINRYNSSIITEQGSCRKSLNYRYDSIRTLESNQDRCNEVSMHEKRTNSFIESNQDFSQEVSMEVHPNNNSFTLVGKIPVPTIAGELDGMATVAEVNLDTLRLEISEKLLKASDDTQQIIDPDSPED